MNIDPLQNSPKVGRDALPVDRQPAGSRPGGQPAAVPAGGLVVSSEGGRFRQLRARLAELPEPAGQAARVKDLTALVASGRYQVDGTRIAKALLRDEPTAALLGLPGSDV
jgi:hypothetical protein